MQKLFGTDGVRGKANDYPITPEIALQLGKAIAHVFRAEGHGSKRAIIGKDTRLSGYMIESAITSGLVSMGMDVYLVGPMPTPAVAHLTKSMGAAVGLMITASHNPADDNGIKVFSHDGFKLSDDIQLQIEALVLGGEISSRHIAFDRIGKAHRIEDARGRYIEFAKSTIDNASLQGLKVVVDCANGAAYFLGPLIFKELGAKVVKLGVEPDGFNINAGCGALATGRLQETVVAEGADIGIAFDGDADRVVFVDAAGELVHGDVALGLLAQALKYQGRLRRDTMVATVMSNLGLYKAMAAAGIEVVTAEVGDRFVLARMREDGLNFGGEQSGHLIYLDDVTTGDGLIAALRMLQLMRRRQASVAELASFITIFPQQLRNLDVPEKKPLASLTALQGEMTACAAALGDRGRHLVRYSGTENKLRLMVEAEQGAEVTRWIERFAAAVRQDLPISAP